MTNLERWLFWLKDVGSPMSFKVWGYYSMVSSILQRKVYLGSEHLPCYGNQFIVLVSPAGKGKGMVTREMEKIFRHPKLLHVANIEEIVAKQPKYENEVVPATQEDQYMVDIKKANAKLQNMMVPMSPNSTTWQSLVELIGSCAQPYTYKDSNGNMRRGFHCSLCVHLEELGSLFTKNTEDVNTLLMQWYDCTENFEYRTKNKGVFQVKNICVNILAGTTPEFLKRVFDSDVLNEGFASRTPFIYEAKEAFRKYDHPGFSKEQQIERELMIDHFVKLTKVVGCISMAPDALAFNRDWWENMNFDRDRINQSTKMDAYYSRKQNTHKKLSMAMHFSDSVEMLLTLDTSIKAYELLNETEKNMHLALQVGNKNPLSDVTRKVIQYLTRNEEGASKKELLSVFFDDLPDMEDMEKILGYLKENNTIVESGRANFYILKKELK